MFDMTKNNLKDLYLSSLLKIKNNSKLNIENQNKLYN
jgi:hypothetical protein